jgi:hypothetical protein
MPTRDYAVFTMLFGAKQKDKTTWEFYKLSDKLSRMQDYLVRRAGGRAQARPFGPVARRTVWRFGCD